MADLTWNCAKCGRTIANGEGSIHINNESVTQAEAAEREWEKSHPPDQAMDIRELMAGGDRTAHWRAHHDDCLEEDNKQLLGDYWFAVERCRSHGDLAFWTIHLSEKPWYAATDWTEFARSALSASGAIDP